MNVNYSTMDMAPDKTSRQLAIAILVFYLLLYLLPLGVRPLTIPDESRYGEIPREMLSTGDWVVPRYDGLRYFEKPPLGYWLNAGSIASFGENAFAVRLPSALAAGLTSLGVYLFALTALRHRRIALYAALIHLSFVEVYGVGTFSILDSTLTMTLTAGILCFYLAAQATKPERALMFWVVSGVSLGLAFLAKGFLALAIPVIVLVPWMLWQGKWHSLMTWGWVVVATAFLVALPWALAIHAREPDFWHYFFWEEHIRRFTADDAQHKAPFYYFIQMLPLLAFPWLTLAPAAISGLREIAGRTSPSPLLRFLWLWFALPLLFFSVSRGKLETYILPCFPPLALLIAAGLHHYLQRHRTRLFNAGVIINFAVIAIVLVALLASQYLSPESAIYHPQESLSYISLAVSMIAVLAAGLVALR